RGSPRRPPPRRAPPRGKPRAAPSRKSRPYLARFSRTRIIRSAGFPEGAPYNDSMAPTARPSLALAPTCTAVWGVGLLVLFLLNRRYDLAYLPGWLAEFGRELTARSPVGADGLVRTAGGLIAAGLIVVAWWGLGSLIRELIVSRDGLGSRVLDWSVRGLLGSGAWSTIWFFLGLAKLYRTSVAVAAVGVGLGLAVWAWRHDRPD